MSDLGHYDMIMNQLLLFQSKSLSDGQSIRKSINFICDIFIHLVNRKIRVGQITCDGRK